MNPEFDLVLACLRWPQESADGDRIRSLAGRAIRWEYLLEIVQHHKVVPLFFRNLETFATGSMPEHVASALRTEAIVNAAACVQRSRQLSQLNRRFREA